MDISNPDTGASNNEKSAKLIRKNENEVNNIICL
jgi:hypothetical protein